MRNKRKQVVNRVYFRSKSRMKGDGNGAEEDVYLYFMTCGDEIRQLPKES
jgi:hypothetical protein